MRQYTVFNVEQDRWVEVAVQGSSRPTPEWDTHREADKVLRASGAKVRHVPGGDRASYSPDGRGQDSATGPLTIRFP